jgi:hypothetical protein
LKDFDEPLHKCSPWSPIMGWVRPIMTELSNEQETFYLKWTN